MIETLYIDGAQHDLVKEYQLLDEKSPFIITVDTGDDTELDNLANDIRSILNQINQIDNVDVKKDLTERLIDCISIQMGEDIKTIADLDEFINTHKRANSYSDEEKKEAKGVDFGKLMTLDSSDMVDTDIQG